MFLATKFLITSGVKRTFPLWGQRHFSSQKSLPSPLEGIRIVDLTRILAGPYCSMILGDLGAEVIKVENPRGGDDVRSWGPPFVHPQSQDDGKESAYFLSVNRNKKSVCINLQDKRGIEIMHSLVKKSDILIENYVPGKLDKMGLGYSDISKIAPHVIYCSISGFGPQGPYAQRAGYDVIAASLGGLMHITGESDGPPVKVGVALTDICTGLYAHGAIMAALLQRNKTGKGQRIDCNLLSTQVATLANLGSNYLNAGQEAKRYGTAHASIVPYQSFKAKDGWMTIGCGNDKQFEEFCSLIERPQLAKNEKFLNNESRVKNRIELIDILTNVMATKGLEEWNVIFRKGNFPYGPVNNFQRVFEDEQVRFLNMEQEMEHQTLGTIKQVGPAVTFSDSRNEMRSSPPVLSSSTNEILKEVLGMEASEIDSLRLGNVIL